MMHRDSAGFTIIEVMLFLAVSGLMMVGLMVGTGAAIQGQQYRDAVQSYANFLRDQYSRVITVENDRLTEDVCPLAEGEISNRGGSNCVIVGRYVATGIARGSVSSESGGMDGQNYGTRPVYALKQNTGQWVYAVGDEDGEYQTNWSVQTNVAGRPTSENVQLGVVMWRDPTQGLLKIALSHDLVPSSLNDFMNTSSFAFAEDRQLCVRGSGLAISQAQSIFIDATAGSGDAIRVGNSAEGCTT